MSGERVPIAAISIDDNGRLLMRPARPGGRIDFNYIYRAAKGIQWNSETNSVVTPPPNERTYSDWFEQVCRGVLEEYGERLVLTPRTEWVNVPDDVRRDILMRALRLESKLRYVSQCTGLRSNRKAFHVVLAGLVVASAGVGLGFSIDYRRGNPSAYVALGIGVLGWVGGAVGMLWGWFSMFSRRTIERRTIQNDPNDPNDPND